jgi:hypothetical protein
LVDPVGYHRRNWRCRIAFSLTALHDTAPRRKQRPTVAIRAFPLDLANQPPFPSITGTKFDPWSLHAHFLQLLKERRMANPASTLLPPYKRVQQPTESLDGIACIAMITGKSIPEIMKVAIEKYKLRATNGPYFFDQERLQFLLATFGYVAGNYLQVKTISDMPELALAWQETDARMELGRHLLFGKTRDPSNPKLSVPYVIDPAATDSGLFTRTDVASLDLSYYISVHPMKAAPK